MDFLTLIKDGKHTAIVSYVKGCKCLSIDEELALISRGNHEEIMSYIAHHWLEIEPFEAFLKRGNLNEVRFYIARHGLYADSALCEAVFQFGRSITAEVVSYMLRERYAEKTGNYRAPIKWAEVECMLIKTEDHCALRQYINQVQLEKKSHDLLKLKGSAEDLLVYDLVWNGQP